MPPTVPADVTSRQPARPASPEALAETDPEVDALLDLAVGALGGARREGQSGMAQAVAAAVRSGEHLLVQAGTGTGKSLGYLVPAVQHAVTADERVVVSTATLALQRQVLTRDLPLVADALAPRLPRTPRIALLKGWHNYACRHKVEGGYPVDEGGTLFDLEPSGAAEHPGAVDGADAAAAPSGARGRRGGRSLADEVRAARAWIEETDSGDRDELVPGVSDRAWRQVSVTALECLGTRCPLLAQCFPERARQAAREADVVVTNHAMLGVAASGSPGALPEHDVLVVDEAHELADRVTAQATVELSVPAIEHAARLARRHGGVATEALDTATQTFGALVAQLPAERYPHGLPDDARLAVAAVRDALRTLQSALKPDPQAKGESGSGMKMAQAAVLAVFEVAERFAADPDGRDVVWCARAGDFGSGPAVSTLYAAPLGVAGLIRSQLLAERTGVFTSATLELGGSFEPAARSLGLVADDVAWRGLDVGSPFDYRRQGILYVARHLDPPGRQLSEQQLAELERLVLAAGGRTLGLFSSRRAAEQAAEALRDRVDLPVLCQGDDQLPTLVREFAEDEATCLFGTLSLWQGVDVPGPSLSLVVIDRIPFPRPDDPVRSARSEAVDAAGGNGFMQVSATHAALLLAQGAGRLVRATTDRGVVAVLDSRLARARYGTFLQRSMPAFWPTQDPAVAAAALERLRS
ncbi:ATP-dependent DNA helicase [Luteimicrobium sp. DT211]|uniref:ATP-dependent DNA helicase n=1 Tax=Luteimicrobium sp. DT211 TaxID=3393412 RepID=UPI003CF50DF4